VAGGEIAQELSVEPFQGIYGSEAQRRLEHAIFKRSNQRIRLQRQCTADDTLEGIGDEQARSPPVQSPTGRKAEHRGSYECTRE
jgi:hypothetical protein